MEDTADTTRINFVVGDGHSRQADQRWPVASGERGEYLTRLIRSLYSAEEQGHAGADLETVKLTVERA
jgi:hypothetical protein